MMTVYPREDIFPLNCLLTLRRLLETLFISVVLCLQFRPPALRLLMRKVAVTDGYRRVSNGFANAWVKGKILLE